MEKQINEMQKALQINTLKTEMQNKLHFQSRHLSAYKFTLWHYEWPSYSPIFTHLQPSPLSPQPLKHSVNTYVQNFFKRKITIKNELKKHLYSSNF